MNANLSTWCFGGAALAAAVALASAVPVQEAREAGALLRTAPAGPDEPEQGLRLDGGGGAALVDAEFSGSEWREKLRDADLDAREENFEEMVRLARRNQAARAWLEERAADTGDAEMAWTARLALREAGVRQRLFERARSGAPGPGIGTLPGRLRALFDRDPFELHFGPGGVGGWLQGPHGPGSTSQSHGVQIESSPDGVKVTVTEIVDGQEKTTLYEGESLEALYEEHPELREKTGGRVFEMRFGDAAFGDLDALFSPGRVPDLEQLLDRHGFHSFGNPPGAGSEDGDVSPVPTHVLGVYIVDEPSDELAQRLGLEPGCGLLVHRTEPRTIAALLGIASGDVLLAINGIPLDGQTSIAQILADRPADGELTVEWIDDAGEAHRNTWVPLRTKREPAPDEER